MLQKHWKTGLLITAGVLLTACASNAPSTSQAGAQPAAARSSSPDYVTSIEVQAATASNAYELISRLRPRWLQPQPTGSLAGQRNQIIAVYLDGIRMGDLAALRSISVTGIKTMQFYDATRAATVLRDPGSTPVAGAIVITTTRVQ